MIRTDCYVAKLDLFRQAFPTAYFEVITRKQYVPETPKHGHILSPSWELLTKAKKNQWSFFAYASALLLDEWKLKFEYPFMDVHQPKNKVIDKLHELYWVNQTQDVFLTCTERQSWQCHREIVKALLLGWTPKAIMEYIHTHNDTLRLYSVPLEEMK